MARAIKGTFEKGRGRWKFMVDGATHSIKCSDLSLPRTKWTKNDSYLLAKEALAAKLETAAPANPNQVLIDELAERQAVASRLGLTADSSRLDKHLTAVKAAKDKLPGIVSKGMLGRNTLNGATDTVWEDRKARAKTTPAGDTADAHAEKFLKFHASQAKAGSKTVGRYGTLKTGVDTFVAWYGPSRSMTELSINTVGDYFAHLAERIETGGRGNASTTMSDHWTTFKQFIDFAAICSDNVPLPKNLRSKMYVFVRTRKEPIPFEKEEIKILIDNSSAQLKAILLLMLNCGYYQGDCGELQAAEIDWKLGRINRARTKLKKNKKAKGDPIKINWLLWDETFDALKAAGNKQGNVFLNQHGLPMKREKIKVNRNINKQDNIAQAYRRLIQKLKNRKLLPKGWHKTLMQLRKTPPNLLATSEEHEDAYNVYLNHSVAKESYLRSGIPSPRFDAAVKWAGEQLGFSTARA